MDAEITMGARAARRKLHKKFKGHIHSIFEQTFNIYDDEDFISITKSKNYRNPINIITNIPTSLKMTALNLKEGKVALMSNNKLLVGDVKIRLENAEEGLPRTRVDNPLTIERILENLDKAKSYLEGKLRGWFSPLLLYLE